MAGRVIPVDLIAVSAGAAFVVMAMGLSVRRLLRLRGMGTRLDMPQQAAARWADEVRWIGNVLQLAICLLLAAWSYMGGAPIQAIGILLALVLGLAVVFQAPQRGLLRAWARVLFQAGRLPAPGGLWKPVWPKKDVSW